MEEIEKPRKTLIHLGDCGHSHWRRVVFEWTGMALGDSVRVMGNGGMPPDREIFL